MASYKFKQTVSEKWGKSKHFPAYAIGGVLLLFFFLIAVAIIGQKTKEFDAKIAQRIDEIHGKIVRENYREIFLQESRKLVSSYSEQEFAELLTRTRPFLNGKIEKNCQSIYKDMVNRLKRNLFLSFEMETDCQVTAGNLNSRQSFGWQVSGDEIRLTWFEFKPQER